MRSLLLTLTEALAQDVEAEVAGLVAEREETYGQINLLTQHIAQLQQEVALARRSSSPGDAATASSATSESSPM